MLKRRYGSKEETPEEHKWVWEGDWVEGVKPSKLPEHVEKEANADPFVEYLNSPKYFGRKGSAVTGEMLLSAARKGHVDPRILAAMVGNESGYGTNSAAVSANNFAGMMGAGNKLFQYPTPQAGLDAAAANLHKKYISKGLDTPEEIGPIYAPTKGATNDPRGINKGWVPTVRSIYDKIPEPLPLAPPAPPKAAPVPTFVQGTPKAGVPVEVKGTPPPGAEIVQSQINSGFLHPKFANIPIQLVHGNTEP